MKKISFYLLFAGLLFLGLNANAQSVALGARGGISIPNLTSGGSNENPLNTGYSSRLGPDFGVFAEFKFSDLFSLRSMIEYSSQGGKKNGLQAFPTPDEMVGMFPAGQAPKYLYANFKSEAKLNYLIIPILAKFGWNINNSPFRIYIDAGPFAGFLLSGKQVVRGESQFYTDSEGQQPLPIGVQPMDNTQDIKDELHTFNLGIEGNIGISHSLRNGNIFIEGGGNYGFLNIQKGTENGKNNTGAGTVAIGYSHWLW